MYYDIFLFLSSQPIGSHLSFSAGDRCFLRGHARLLAMYRAFSMPVAFGGRELFIWIHRLEERNGVWTSLAPIHPWDVTEDDLVLWPRCEKLPFFSPEAIGMWIQLAPAWTSPPTTIAAITYLRLQHEGPCGQLSTSISDMRDHIHVLTCD